MSKSSYFTKDRVERPWLVVDAEGQVLGRMAQGIAKLLIGKDRPEFTPGQDCGSFVVVVNSAKVVVTGKKLDGKVYYRHSGYPGGIKSRTLRERLDRDPNEVIREAVKGMLPHNKLGNRLITKLKVYTSGDHPHVAQGPTVVTAEQLVKL